MAVHPIPEMLCISNVPHTMDNVQHSIDNNPITLLLMSFNYYKFTCTLSCIRYKQRTQICLNWVLCQLKYDYDGTQNTLLNAKTCSCQMINKTIPKTQLSSFCRLTTPYMFWEKRWTQKLGADNFSTAITILKAQLFFLSAISGIHTVTSCVKQPTEYSFYCIIFTCNANCSKWGRQVRTNCRCILACWGLDNSDWSSDGSLTHNHRPAVTNTDILKNKLQEHKNGKLYYNLECTYF